MLIIRKVVELRKVLDDPSNAKKTTGFVPTMGAMHKGHLSLINCSKKNNDITVVSIFVNPTQFNNEEDLKKYPRDEKKDLLSLEITNPDIVFIPEVNEMYPKEDRRIFDLNGLDTVMEGKYRKGHFNGVAQVVSNLFEIVKPDRSYFGRKDFQQVAIIKYLNNKYFHDLKIEIIACDIIREFDGLAMSSRNLILTDDQRAAAPLISKTIFKFQKDFKKYSVSEIKSLIINEINNNQNLEVEYIEIVDNKTLNTVEKIIEGCTTACIAVFAGKVRLIDNVSF